MKLDQDRAQGWASLLAMLNLQILIPQTVLTNELIQ